MMKITPTKMSPIEQKISQLRTNMTYSAAMGDYNGFKEASKAYAKEAIKNFGVLKKIKSPQITAPLFSKIGFNIMKVMVLNFFRKKTPAEKQLAKLAELQKIKKKFNTNG